jgi:hypothetical protein
MPASLRQSEKGRLEDVQSMGVPWRKWGPYLSERQWGTVREDYSDDGNAWEYFSHDQARSRVYHWGEDGLAGISDDKQRMCFAIALWNGADPILKERLFGLTNNEGNHGEDVKEYYYYLDSTPTHSYMKYLYRYPQRAYPYTELVEQNRKRTRLDFEYELIDSGIFEDDRYFDVFVEYAKRTPEDLLIQITIENRGPDPATLHLLPTLWFRNSWAWWPDPQKPSLEQQRYSVDIPVVSASHPLLGEYSLHVDRNVPLLFTENETNRERLYQQPSVTPYVKDGINDFVTQGRREAVNAEGRGTKCAAHYNLTVPARGSETVRLRLCRAGAQTRYVNSQADFFATEFPFILEMRKQEADEFYDSISPAELDADGRMVMRQALAGMLWSKQHYFFDLQLWLREHNAKPGERGVRNTQWFHMLNDDVISMPDKWEYPWYAAWDLAFHTIPLAMVDLDFAKHQLEMIFEALYIHPSGQIPAYEWNFSDVNPPVHAWAAMYLYNQERESTGTTDVGFLKRCFDRLVFNFAWWVNQKDPSGRNLFEGGFLGMDNIGVLDRSAQLPEGGRMEQADGTAWMAFFCQNMLEIARELATHDPSYQVMATKFCEHFLWIASAMDRMGEHADSLWNQEDGFYYDVLRFADGRACHFQVRTLVGLLPLCAATVFFGKESETMPEFVQDIKSFLGRNSQLMVNLAPLDKKGHKGRHLLSILNEKNLRRLLGYMLDEKEFLSDYGIRSVSRAYQDHPYAVRIAGQEFRIDYEPGESHSSMFGGNSNWRGPIWFPINLLILRGLLMYYLYYGDEFKVECPTGSGQMKTLFEVCQEISRRLCSIFLRDEKHEGRRPVFGGSEKFQKDPFWRDCILFYEYFHGDNGAGIGASHQTGWTGLVARLLQLSVGLDAEQLLESEHKLDLMRHLAGARAAVAD